MAWFLYFLQLSLPFYYTIVLDEVLDSVRNFLIFYNELELYQRSLLQHDSSLLLLLLLQSFLLIFQLDQVLLILSSVGHGLIGPLRLLVLMFKATERFPLVAESLSICNWARIGSDNLLFLFLILQLF